MNADSPEKPNLRQRFREQAREEILETARRVFARDGIDARIDAIAAEAGVSVGTIYNLYGDRAGLVVAVTDRGREEFAALVQDFFERTAEAPFDERLRGLVRLLVGHMREHWNALRMLAQAEDSRCGPGPRPTPAMIRAVHGRMSELVRQGIASGDLADVDPHVAACALMGAVRTTIDVDLNLGLDAPTDARADAIVKLFLEGAAPRR